jgi:hypothetical protein
VFAVDFFEAPWLNAGCTRCMSSSIRAFVKGALFKWFPGAATQLFSARARAYSQALVKSWGCLELNRKIIQRFGNHVLHGPFSGMELSRETRREHLAPYLLGIYECELHPVWDSVFQMQFDQILDVGAKFGFYAVGLARRFPETPVLAFDTDPWARKATREMSSANGVDVKVLGICCPEWMRRNLQKNTFILSDCEGYEATLFGSVEIPNFSSATMLIEMHEQFSPGVTRRIVSKYAGSHEIMTIPAGSTDAKLPPEMNCLTEAERQMAVNEYRTACQSWILLKPKAR